jgi:hypothetical protein
MHLLKYRRSEYPYLDVYQNMILIILDKIDIFCYENRKALLQYQNDKHHDPYVSKTLHLQRPIFDHRKQD